MILTDVGIGKNDQPPVLSSTQKFETVAENGEMGSRQGVCFPGRRLSCKDSGNKTPDLSCVFVVPLLRPAKAGTTSHSIQF